LKTATVLWLLTSAPPENKHNSMVTQAVRPT